MAEMVTKEYSRRDFVVSMGGLGLAVMLGGATVLKPFKAFAALPSSTGYIVVDTDKCASCESCMIACSLAHEGTASLSNARLQVLRNVFGNFPSDIVQHQCRQCVDPACVAICPAGACTVDTVNGNVRRIDKTKCIGCKQCISACPFVPSRVQWHATENVSQKCDLCKGLPNWTGGPACVAVCPMKALKLVTVVPEQSGDSGYRVNLKTAKWGQVFWIR